MGCLKKSGTWGTEGSGSGIVMMVGKKQRRMRVM